MKKFIIIVIGVMIFSASCKERSFLFTSTHRKIFENSKIDLKSLQFYSPRRKCVFLAAKTISGDKINPYNCQINSVASLARERIKIASKTKLACVKVDGTDMYISFDKAYSSLLFRETSTGYSLVTKDGFVTINGKEYWVKGDFFLRIKGKIFRKRNTDHIRAKGNTPECK